MAEELMIRCDNPKCRTVGMPEDVQPRKGRKSATHTAPYGWLELQGWFVGTGPNINVEVCSLECLEPAIEDKIREEREKYGQ